MPIEQLPEEFIHSPKAVFDKLNEVIAYLNAPFLPVISDEDAEKLVAIQDEVKVEPKAKYVSSLAAQIDGPNYSTTPGS